MRVQIILRFCDLRIAESLNFVSPLNRRLAESKTFVNPQNRRIAELREPAESQNFVGGPRRGGGRKFRAFFSLFRLKFCSFCYSGGLFVALCQRFKAVVQPNCTFGPLWVILCELRRPEGEGTERWSVGGAKGGRPKISRFFSFAAAIFVLSSLSGESLRGIVAAVQGLGLPKVRVWAPQRSFCAWP